MSLLMNVTNAFNEYGDNEVTMRGFVSLPIGADILRQVMRALVCTAKMDTPVSSLRFSFHYDAENCVLGLEAKNGRKATFTIPRTLVEIPDVSEDYEEYNMVSDWTPTTHSWHTMLMGPNGAVNVIYSLTQLHLGFASNVANPRLRGANAALLGSANDEVIVNANGSIETQLAAEVRYKKPTRFKSLLGKAGRSKPQGVLFAYFTSDSCSFDGVNGDGEDTLEYSSAGTSRILEHFNSNIEDEEEEKTVIAVRFPYKMIFDILYSKRYGILHGRSTLNPGYGVVDRGPAISIAGAEDCDSLPKGVKLVIAFGDMLPGDPTRYQASTNTIQTLVAVAEAAAAETPTVSTVDFTKYPMEHRSALREWYDIHVADCESRGKVASTSTTAWFSSYLLHCARQGQISDPVAQEIYEAVKDI